MKAIIHIVRQTFNARNLPDDEVNRLLFNFAEFIIYGVNKTTENPERPNIFMVNRDKFLNKQWVHDGIRFYDIFFGDIDSIADRCPRDLIKMLRLTTNHYVKETKQTPTPLTLRHPRTDERHGLCVMRHIGKFTNIPQVLSSKYDLARFRITHFVEHEDADSFFIECDTYLDNLVFHPDIKSEYRAKYKSHRRQIAPALLDLNRYYLAEYAEFNGQSYEFAEHFATIHGYQGGSGEGNPAKMNKPPIARMFEGRDRLVTPDPHLKFYNDDDGKHDEHARIYFETPVSKTASKLYICHIVKHL